MLLEKEEMASENSDIVWAAPCLTIEPIIRQIIIECLTKLKLRDECLNGELFLSLAEARYIVDHWSLDYDCHQPHSRLGWMMPAESATSCTPCGATVLETIAEL